MSEIVIIRGSWGHLKVDRATGVLLAYDDEGTVDGFTNADETGYRDILFILPETLRPGLDECLDRYGETDILCIGYVTDSGTVVESMQREIGGEFEGLYLDMPRLPAPACVHP